VGLTDPEAVAEPGPADDAEADADAVVGADTAPDGLVGGWEGVPPEHAAVARQTEIAIPAITGLCRRLGRPSVCASFIT
jgi:hypothetical protein